MQGTGGLVGSVLRGESLRNLARSLFQAFYEQNMSANQALKTLRELGLGYRRQDFLSDYRQGRETWERGTNIRFVRDDAVPSDRTFAPVYHGLPDHYGYRVRLEVVDVNGQRDVRYRWFFTDYKGTKGEIKSYITTAWNKPDLYSGEIEDIFIEDAHINPYWEEF